MLFCASLLLKYMLSIYSFLNCKVQTLTQHDQYPTKVPLYRLLRNIESSHKPVATLLFALVVFAAAALVVDLAVLPVFAFPP